MLTVSEAARRTGKDPETIRRWIRAGRLQATKVGRRHMIEAEDLVLATEEPRSLPLPEAWRTFDSGRPVPDPARAVDDARRAR